MQIHTTIEALLKANSTNMKLLSLTMTRRHASIRNIRTHTTTAAVAKNEIYHYEAAIIDYDEAIQLKPDFAEAYTNRGVAKHRLGRYVAAIADCDKAIQLRPDEALAYANRGYVKTQLSQQEAAIADCNEALRLDPYLAVAYNSRAIAKNNGWGNTRLRLMTMMRQ